MISSILLAAVPASVPCGAVPAAEIVEIPVSRASRVNVDVSVPGTIFQYGYELAVEEVPDEDGFLLRRAHVRPPELPRLGGPAAEGEEDSPTPPTPAQRSDPAASRARHVPPLHVAADGAFTGFRETQAHVERLAQELYPGFSGEQRESLVHGLGSSESLDAWLTVPRHEWNLLGAWRGMSLEPGKRIVEGELFLPVATLPSLPRTFQVEVAEPVESDGRTLVRLRRKTQVAWADLGDHVLGYLAAHGSTLSRMKVLDVQGTHVEELFVDLDTGLPVRLTNEVRIALAQKTNRGKKRHNERSRKSFRYDWTLRGE